MIGKIFNKLKTSYSHLGLGDDILRSHATMLAATGLVTEENLETIIVAQSDYLSGLQKLNDKRVTDVMSSIKTASEEDKRKALEELKSTLSKQQEEEKVGLLTQIEELKSQIKPKEEVSDDMKAYVENLLKAKEEASKKETAEWEKRLSEIIKTNQEQAETLKALKQENEQIKRDKAQEERNSFISNTATKLEIPAWRISEGFAITDDMDNTKIEEYLGTVANNMKVANLQTKGLGNSISGGKEATRDEVSELLKGF